MNQCHFSPCRRYRYSLVHVIEEMQLLYARKRVMWIGLNPSTADETTLDPTLRRIRAFTMRETGTEFVMTNLFAWRDTLPENMKAAADPVGPLNDATLFEVAASSDLIVCAWGNDGEHLERASHVAKLLSPFSLRCLGRNKARTCPRHPLYLGQSTELEAWK